MVNRLLSQGQKMLKMFPISVSMALIFMPVFLFRWVFSIAALVSSVGCTSSALEWQEEVKLQSGEVLVVKRTVKGIKSFGEIGGPGGWSSESMTVSVVHPARSDNPPIWEGPFVPLLFDRDAQSGQWFMVATFYSCESWYGLGKPKLPYTEYHLKNGKWQQQSLSPGLIGRKANMLTSIHSTGEVDHTLTTKEKADSGADLEYKQIVSEWSTGC